MEILEQANLHERLKAALALQRAAYLAHPVPTLEERTKDLRTLQRFIRENRNDICAAISADYGHRSTHETMLAEIFRRSMASIMCSSTCANG